MRRSKPNIPKDLYAEAGVDIEAGNRFVDLIKPIVQRTQTPGVITNIGGFAGLFSLHVQHVKNPGPGQFNRWRRYQAQGCLHAR